ncbi:hypothetical protein AOLI_G00099510 [Acnodon oligacanthus]
MTVCKYLNLLEGTWGDTEEGREIGGVSSQRLFHRALSSELHLVDRQRILKIRLSRKLWVSPQPHCAAAPLCSDWLMAGRAAGAVWEWNGDESERGSKRAPAHRAWTVLPAPASTASADRRVNPGVSNHHTVSCPSSHKVSICRPDLALREPFIIKTSLVQKRAFDWVSSYKVRSSRGHLVCTEMQKVTCGRSRANRAEHLSHQPDRSEVSAFTQGPSSLRSAPIQRGEDVSIAARGLGLCEHGVGAEQHLGQIPEAVPGAAEPTLAQAWLSKMDPAERNEAHKAACTPH